MPVIDLLVVSSLPSALEAALASSYRLLRSPAQTVRGVVGGGMSRVDGELIGRLPKLEIIAIHGVGYEGVDLEAAHRAGARVTTTPGVLTDDVADLALGLMLAVQRRIAANDALVRSGHWRVPLGRRASGRTMGVFGMGAIGRAIAKRVEPLAAAIVYTSRNRKPDLPYRFLPRLEDLAGECEVLFIAAAGGSGTAQAVDALILERLGPEGVLVNVARGSIIDESALVRALQEGRIAGAGLDVFAHEPEVPSALRALDTVVLQPHQGSATREGREAMAALVVANLQAQFSGTPLLSAVV